MDPSAAHLFVHELIGEALCCFPSAVISRPEVWASGLFLWWAYRAGVMARLGGVVHGVAGRLRAKP